MNPRDLYSWPRSPIRVTGGLRARSRRGSIGETWWSRRFLDALETVVDRNRLARGRHYAREGQVLEMDVAPAVVAARVQGSSPEPYETRLELPALSADAWRAVAAAMASRAIFLARLLSGEMPRNIEEAFDAAGVALFPIDEVTFFCSCPDSWVCKHVAAVCYLLAESFDVDPFLMFTWRGRRREELIAELRAQRPRLPTTRRQARGAGTGDREPDTLRGGPREPPSFWEGEPDVPELRVSPRATTPSDALFRELDDTTRRALGDVPELLRPLYLEFVPAARRLLDPELAATPAPSPRRRARGRSQEGC